MASSRKARRAASFPGAQRVRRGSPVTGGHDAVSRVEAAVKAALDGGHRAVPAGSASRFSVEAPVAVAFSGGIDSSVLLHATVAAVGASRCIALHVHHGLSPHADAWAGHCAAVAGALQVRFAVARVTVVAGGSGIEAAARDARYRALARLCTAAHASVLLLGHHADDQAETFMLQLLRGAGLPGLAAMAAHDLGAAPAAMPPGMPPRARPLLGVERTDLEAYARIHGLHWVDDESNRSLRIARNALRHDVMPALQRRFPAYRGSLARAAAHAAQAQALLDDLARIDLATVRLPDDAVSRQAMQALSAPRMTNVLRYWIRQSALPALPAVRLGALIVQLRGAGADAVLGWPHAGRMLRLYRDALHWTDASAPRPAAGRVPAALVWAGQPVWYLPAWGGTLVFERCDDVRADGGGRGVSANGAAADDTAADDTAADATTADDTAADDTTADDTAADDIAADAAKAAVALRPGAVLIARARQPGDTMRTAPGAPARTLKNLFQEAGMARWRRDVPVFTLDGVVLFVPGLGLNGAHGAAQAAGGAPRWRLTWRPTLSIS